jgi:hypothetical protein
LPTRANRRLRRVALNEAGHIPLPVRVVKQQINGSGCVVLKENAMAQDLKTEAMRLKAQFGYEIQLDKRHGTYTASHPFFQGKFVLMLVPD